MFFNIKLFYERLQTGKYFSILIRVQSMVWNFKMVSKSFLDTIIASSGAEITHFNFALNWQAENSSCKKR